MGYMKAKFDDMQFQWVEGYKISACWVPKQGFQGNFYVYLWERIEAATPFRATPEIGKDGAAKRGSLSLADDDHTYSFDKIDATSAQLGATRRERYRIFEFRYDKGLTTEEKPSVRMNNSSSRDLNKTALGDDYKFDMGGGQQYLLGFRTCVASSGANVFRFVSLRCKGNSFLEKMVDLNSQNVDSAKISEFTIQFPQGQITVNQDNLLAFYADEAWGSFATLTPPPLMDLTSGQSEQKFVRLDPADFSPLTLLQRDAHHEHHEESFKPDTVQTGTFIFKPGTYQDFKIK